MKDYIYVHLLVCYLNKLQNEWCNDKDIKIMRSNLMFTILDILYY